MPRALMITGDAAEDLDAMYPLYRLREAGWEVDVAAPSRRPVQLVVHDFEEGFDAYSEKPGRRLPVDLTFAEVEVERYGALVIPGGRAPEYIRTDPDVRRIVEHFFAERPPGRRGLPRAAGARGVRAPARAGARPPSRRCRETWRTRARRSWTRPTWSTATWSRAVAGRTCRSGRERSSPCSSGQRCPPSRSAPRSTPRRTSSARAPGTGGTPPDRPSRARRCPQPGRRGR